MEKLVLEGTDNTPEVTLDNSKHYLHFKGDSRPEDVRKFYLPILEWIKEYEKHLYFLKDQSSGITITANFEFEYFNSSSAKYLMDIIVSLGEIEKIENINFILNWYYDAMDEDMLDSGEEFQDMLGIDFNFIKVD
jgi:hypothetical protein